MEKEYICPSFMSANKSNRHPKGLYMLFTTEMWERFNFYGMRAILTLFLVYGLGYSKPESTEFYGGFLGMSYLLNLLGGYIADNILGNRRTIIWGGFMMALGQFMLFTCGNTITTSPELSNIAFWSGILLIVFGVGFFKPNISSIVGFLYKEGDKKIESAFTLFYMGINLGALLGQWIAPYFGDVVVDGVRDVYAFKWGFFSAGVAMVIGTLTFIFLKNKYLVDPDGNAIGVLPNAKKNKKKNNRFFPIALLLNKRILMSIGIFVVCLFVFYFFVDDNPIYTFIYSTGIALALYIITDKQLSKIEIHRILVIYVVSFFVMFFWACFEQAGSSLTFIADNQTDRNFLGWFTVPAGAVQNANSFFIITLAIPISMFWVRLKNIGFDLFSVRKQALGLLLLGLGFLLVAIKLNGLNIETKISMFWLFGLYFFHTVGELCLSPIGLSLVSKLAPYKYKSLLMGVWFFSSAAGYSLSGTLGSLLPPTNEQYAKAEQAGINLKSVLDNEISLSETQTAFLQKEKLPEHYPDILGIKIENLFDFFMIFFFLASGSSVLLFLISGKLKLWMHGLE